MRPMSEKTFLVKMQEAYTCCLLDGGKETTICSHEDAMDAVTFQSDCKGNLKERPDWCPLVEVEDSFIPAISYYKKLQPPSKKALADGDITWPIDCLGEDTAARIQAAVNLEKSVATITENVNMTIKLNEKIAHLGASACAPKVMTGVWKRLDHGMYLDAKSVMDNAMPLLRRELRDLVPLKLHHALDEVLARFEDELVESDIRDKLYSHKKV